MFDEFTAYVQKCKDDRKEQGGTDAIFPCILDIIKDACFNRSAPIIMGVTVKAGFLKIGTPLCVPEKDVSFSLVHTNPFVLESENWIR